MIGAEFGQPAHFLYNLEHAVRVGGFVVFEGDERGMGACIYFFYIGAQAGGFYADGIKKSADFVGQVTESVL